MNVSFSQFVYILVVYLKLLQDISTKTLIIKYCPQCKVYRKMDIWRDKLWLNKGCLGLKPLFQSPLSLTKTSLLVKNFGARLRHSLFDYCCPEHSFSVTCHRSWRTGWLWWWWGFCRPFQRVWSRVPRYGMRDNQIMFWHVKPCNLVYWAEIFYDGQW